MGIVAVGAMEGAQATRINDNVPIKIIKITSSYFSTYRTVEEYKKGDSPLPAQNGGSGISQMAYTRRVTDSVLPCSAADYTSRKGC